MILNILKKMVFEKKKETTHELNLKTSLSTFSKEVFLIEFLDYVKNRGEGDLLRISKFNYVKEIGDFNKKLKKMIDQEYLCETNNYEKLNFLKVIELKEILKSKKLKISGKKDELIDRISSNFKENELRYYVGEDTAYKLTEKGSSLVGAHRETENNKYKEMKLKIASEISKGNLIDALKITDGYHFSSRGMLFNKNELIQVIEEKSVIKLKILEKIIKLDFKELSNSQEYKNNLKECMALNYIIHGFIPNKNIINEFVKENSEIINSKHLDYCFENYLNYKKVNDENKLYELFLFYLRWLHNKQQLKEHKKAFNKVTLVKHGAEECPVCKGKSNLKEGVTPVDIGCTCVTMWDI